MGGWVGVWLLSWAGCDHCRPVNFPPCPARRRDPETTEEEELVENLFDVVASCLLLPENRAVFVDAEGAPCVLC